MADDKLPSRVEIPEHLRGPLVDQANSEDRDVAKIAARAFRLYLNLADTEGRLILPSDTDGELPAAYARDLLDAIPGDGE